MKVTEEMIDRAMAIQGLRSDRRTNGSDRHWMEQSLRAALEEGYKAFPNAPGLDEALGLAPPRPKDG